MTIRYLLLIGDQPERHVRIATAVAAKTELRITHQSAGFTALTSRSPAMSPAAGALIIGDLYAGSAPVAANAGEPGRFIRDPVALVEGCWGRYIAVFPDPAGLVSILRDPSGALPCYYRSAEELTVVASDVELLASAAPLPPRLNWTEIARILGAGDLRSPATGLSDVLELPAGELLTIEGAKHRRSSIWTPARFAAAVPSDDVEDHARRLRAATEQVMAALGRSYPTALATVSGGLDSSIVALALAPVVGQLTCLTVATEDPSGDERRYAHLVADAASADYKEAFLQRTDVDLRRSQAEHLPRPTGRPFMQSLARIIADTAANVGADAVFNGSGGDNVFCFLQSATPLADRVAAQGVLRGLATLRDIAKMLNASYGEVAAATWRRLRRTEQRYRWRYDTRLLSPSASEAARAFDHPWLDLPAGGRLGTAVHIAMILRTQNYLDAWRPGERFEAINPLLAQPIVEQCLTIPTWSWCSGGSDRAIARLAYADRLPAAVRSRSWKGGPEGFIGRLAEENRALLRTRLVDGELAAHGVIDRASVATMLDDPHPFSSSDALRLLSLSDAEAWVRAKS